MVKKSSYPADLAMSPSTKSKPESPSSPATGEGGSDKPAAEKADRAEKAQDGDKFEPRTGPIAIELELSRQRAATMTVFGLVVGSLLIWKLGTVGVWVGVVLVVVGLFRAWELAQTFLYPPGTIEVTDSQVVLPRGLCMPRPVKVAPADVTAVYFLRRSVPWNKSAPVLVVELGDRAMAYPRDWFASEADQRHVIHALLRALPGGESAAAADTAEPSAAREKVQLGEARSAWTQMGAGVALLAIGIVGSIVSRSQAGAGGQYALYIGPMVAGLILLLRGFARW